MVDRKNDLKTKNIRELEKHYSSMYKQGFEILKKMGFKNINKGLGAKEQGDINLVSLKKKFNDKDFLNRSDNFKKNNSNINSSNIALDIKMNQNNVNKNNLNQDKFVKSSNLILNKNNFNNEDLLDNGEDNIDNENQYDLDYNELQSKINQIRQILLEKYENISASNEKINEYSLTLNDSKSSYNIKKENEFISILESNLNNIYTNDNFNFLKILENPKEYIKEELFDTIFDIIKNDSEQEQESYLRIEEIIRQPIFYYFYNNNSNFNDKLEQYYNYNFKDKKALLAFLNSKKYINCYNYEEYQLKLKSLKEINHTLTLISVKEIYQGCNQIINSSIDFNSLYYKYNSIYTEYKDNLVIIEILPNIYNLLENAFIMNEEFDKKYLKILNEYPENIKKIYFSYKIKYCFSLISEYIKLLPQNYRILNSKKLFNEITKRIKNYFNNWFINDEFSDYLNSNLIIEFLINCKNLLKVVYCLDIIQPRFISNIISYSLHDFNNRIVEEFNEEFDKFILGTVFDFQNDLDDFYVNWSLFNSLIIISKIKSNKLDKLFSKSFFLKYFNLVVKEKIELFMKILKNEILTFDEMKIFHSYDNQFNNSNELASFKIYEYYFKKLESLSIIINAWCLFLDFSILKNLEIESFLIFFIGIIYNPNLELKLFTLDKFSNCNLQKQSQSKLICNYIINSDEDEDSNSLINNINCSNEGLEIVDQDEDDIDISSENLQQKREEFKINKVQSEKDNAKINEFQVNEKKNSSEKNKTIFLDLSNVQFKSELFSNLISSKINKYTKYKAKYKWMVRFLNAWKSKLDKSFYEKIMIFIIIPKIKRLIFDAFNLRYNYNECHNVENLNNEITIGSIYNINKFTFLTLYLKEFKNEILFKKKIEEFLIEVISKRFKSEINIVNKILVELNQ